MVDCPKDRGAIGFFDVRHPCSGPDERLDAARARGVEFVAGHPIDEVDRLMFEFPTEALQSRVHPGVMVALNEHRPAGDPREI